jgi:hypothetical protein
MYVCMHVYVWLYVCVGVCVGVSIYTFIHMYGFESKKYIHIHMYICTYAYTHRPTHTHTHTHTRICTQVQSHTERTHLLISLPHTYGLVVAPAHDTLAVTRPSYTSNSPCVSLQQPDLLPCSNIPHTYSRVMAPTDDESVIRRQRHAPHPVIVPLQCVHHYGTSPLKMPYNDDLVHAAADKQICIAAAPRNTPDSSAMALQGLRCLRPPNNFPHTYSIVTMPCTCNKSAVWRPCYTHDIPPRACQCLQLLACLHAPNPHCPVVRAACYFRAIQRNLDMPHSCSVPRERAQLRRSLPVRETLHLDALVFAAAADKQGATSSNVYGTDPISMGFSKRERAHALVSIPHLECPVTIAAYNECAVA